MVEIGKKLFAVSLSLFIAASFGVHTGAAEKAKSLEAKTSGENKVTVKGEHPLGEGMRVTINVFNPIGDLFYRRELTAGENGKFEAVFALDDIGETEAEVDKSGSYTVTVGGAGIEAENTTFTFINHITGTDIVDAANSATTKELVKQKLFTDGAPETFADKLCLDYKEGSSFAKIVDKDAVYYGMQGFEKSLRYSTAAEITESFNTAVAVQTLNEAKKADAKATVLTFAELLKINTGKGSNFERLKTENGKNFAYEAVVAEKLDTQNQNDNASVTFEKAVYTALFNEVDTETLDNFVTYLNECNEKGYTDISLEDYNDELLTDTDRAKILKDVIENYMPFSDLNAVKSGFEQTAEDALEDAEEEEKHSSSSGSGGGGGRQSSVKVGAGAITAETKPSVDAKKSAIFNDMEQTAWAVTAVDYLAGRNVVSGVAEGNFLPNGAVKREEFVKMLVLALNVQTEETEKEFKDVLKDAWYYEPVMTAYAANIVKGVDFDVFGTGSPITREQMCTFIYRAMNLLDINIEDNEKSFDFKDADTVSDYAKDAVLSLYRAGIVNGVSETEFNPKGEATRAMAAQMIYQLIIRGNVA